MDAPAVAMKRLIEDMSKNLNLIDHLDPDELERLVLSADDEYHAGSGKSAISDEVYDIAKDRLKRIRPNSSVATAVGAKPRGLGTKVVLPVFMGSLNKIKTGEEVERFAAKYIGPYSVSDKMDGVSALLQCDGQGGARLMTRGDGKEGEDISFLLDHISGIPDLSTLPKMIVRGELILTRSAAEELKREGLAFKNLRALVAGTVNSVSMRRPSVMTRIRYVVYTYISESERFSPSAQVQELEEKGFQYTAANWRMERLSVEELTNKLVERRAVGRYEIDGLVIVDDLPRPCPDSGNPKHAFAFKSMLTHEKVESVVRAVVWDVSKDALLKPVVELNPVDIGGVTISRVTGSNARFIVENNIGPGAVVVLVRSGDVIPAILSVKKPSLSGKPDLPDEDGTWGWTDSNVDIIMLRDTPALQKRRMLHFATKIGAKGISDKTISSMFDAGFDSIEKLAGLTIEDIAALPGFRAKSAEKVAKSLSDAVDVASDVQLIVACNALGRGFASKKLDDIKAAFPNMAKATVDGVQKMHGFSEKTATTFVQRIGAAMQMVEGIRVAAAKNRVSALSGKTSTDVKDA